MSGSLEPDTRGNFHVPIWVSLGPIFDDGGSGLDWSRAELRTRDIHLDLATLSGFFLSPPQVADHSGPGFRAVMRAVDSHAIHATGKQIPNEFIICGCFGRHCYPNSDVPLLGIRSEKEGVFRSSRRLPPSRSHTRSCGRVANPNHLSWQAHPLLRGPRSRHEPLFAQARTAPRLRVALAVPKYHAGEEPGSAKG